MGCLLAMERAPLGVTQQALKASYADGVLISSVLYAFGSFSHTPKIKKGSGMVLEGKVAMVTASSRGIGLEIARYFSREGAKIAMTSRRLENVSRAAEQIGAFPIRPMQATLTRQGPPSSLP